MEVTGSVQEQHSRFYRNQILESAAYRKKRDLLTALLEENREYTKKETDLMIEQYEKGKVQ